MKDYYSNFVFNNIINKNYQQISGFNKFPKKRKKFIANNYNWKEFHSDEEDNSYYNLALNDNYINQNKIKKNRRLSQNSVSTNAEKSLKSNIINIMNKKLKNINSITKNTKLNEMHNKKVHFLNKNFVKYIDVESLKKYNINEESFLENKENSDKADAKCTCFIY